MSEEYVYPDQVRQKMAGNTLLMIGAGGIGRRFIWTSLHRTNLKVILVDSSADSHGVLEADTFIHYDYQDPRKLQEHATEIIRLLGDRVEAVAGCLTFSDDSAIPLTAMICQKLGLRGTDPDAAMITMSKHRTYEILRMQPQNSEYATDIHSPMSFRIENADDITNVKNLEYPAILKPEHDSFARGVKRVVSTEDCLQHYDAVQKMFGNCWDGKGFGNSIVLMELLQGRSYDVDIVIYDGECLAAFVTDMGPVLPEVYVTTTTCTPTSLPVRMKEKLTTAAFRCCLRAGLRNDVYNLEFKIDKFGNIKLVEINGRVACYRRCIVYETTHGVDLFEITAAIACGIKPRFPDLKPRCCAVGCYLYPLYHGIQISKSDVMAKLVTFLEAEDILLIMRTRAVDVVVEDFPKPFGHLVALGETQTSARRKLIKLFLDLGLLRDDFDIETFTHA